MTSPYQPTDLYRTDAPTAESSGWQAPYTPDPKQSVVYVPNNGLPTPAEREAARERRAVTLRIVVALSMAIPLTAISATLINNGLAQLLGIAMAWIGIVLVVYLSHGKGFPFPRN